MKTKEQLEKAKQEYIRSGGNACYKCNSNDIEGGSVDINAGTAIQSVWCNNCELSWEDHYLLNDVVES